MTEAEKLATNLDYLRRFARGDKTPEGKPILRATALFCVDQLEQRIKERESLLATASECKTCGRCPMCQCYSPEHADWCDLATDRETPRIPAHPDAMFPFA